MIDYFSNIEKFNIHVKELTSMIKFDEAERVSSNPA